MFDQFLFFFFFFFDNFSFTNCLVRNSFEGERGGKGGEGKEIY